MPLYRDQDMSVIVILFQYCTIITQFYTATVQWGYIVYRMVLQQGLKPGFWQTNSMAKWKWWTRDYSIIYVGRCFRQLKFSCCVLGKQTATDTFNDNAPALFLKIYLNKFGFIEKKGYKEELHRIANMKMAVPGILDPCLVGLSFRLSLHLFGYFCFLANFVNVKAEKVINIKNMMVEISAKKHQCATVHI